VGSRYSLTTATADCPSGKKALGGGYLITAVDSYYCAIPAMASYPSDGDTWTVTGNEGIESYCSGGWSIQAYVICATIS
jgi:hypothetical protein